MKKRKYVSARAIKNHIEYNKKYNRENTIFAGCRLNKKTDAEYIAIYREIPNKVEWFRECLTEFRLSHLKKD